MKKISIVTATFFIFLLSGCANSSSQPESPKVSPSESEPSTVNIPSLNPPTVSIKAVNPATTPAPTDIHKDTTITSNSLDQLSGAEYFNEIYGEIKAESTYFTQPIQRTMNDIWWISDDNWNILVPPNLSLIAKIRPIQPRGTVANKDEFKKLNAIVKDVLVKNGFALNTLNSSDNELDEKFYDYIQAYELQDTKCVATSNFDVGRSGNETQDSSSFIFGCFDDSQLEAARNQQIPFLKALSKPQNNFDGVITNLTINGDRAGMGVGWRRTGAGASMYKAGGEWKVISVGQDSPSCEDLKARNIPLKYWVNCYENNGNALRTFPQ